MGKRLILFLFASILSFSGCEKSESTQPAQLQIISMIPSVQATVALTPAGNSGQKSVHSLSYASPSGYQSYAPGLYSISYSIKDKTVLKHAYALGKNSHQTLMVAGMAADSLQTNPKTTLFSIREILAGSENDDPNGYMPQYIMLRDQYGGDKNEGMIRLVNLSPFAQPLSINQGNKTLLKAAYPHYTEPFDLTPGAMRLRLFMDKIPLSEKSVLVKKGYLQTIVAGNGAASGSVTTASYETPSKTIQP